MCLNSTLCYSSLRLSTPLYATRLYSTRLFSSLLYSAQLSSTLLIMASKLLLCFKNMPSGLQTSVPTSLLQEHANWTE